MPNRTVAVIVGSLRRASLNLKMAQALARLAPAGLALKVVPLPIVTVGPVRLTEPAPRKLPASVAAPVSESTLPEPTVIVAFVVRPNVPA